MGTGELVRTIALVLCIPAGIALSGESATADDSPGRETVWPTPEWTVAEPSAMGLDAAELERVREYALSGGGAGYVTRHGRLVMSWGDARKTFDLKSTTKSFGSIALGVAIKDGKVRLEDQALRLHPTLGTPPKGNAETGWLDEITLLHLASQTAGFEKPGGYTKLLFRPGTQWDYSDSGPNWLAECLTLAYRRDLNAWMFERVFSPLGIKPSDLRWRKNAYRPAELEGVARREFGSGIHANVDAMARIGYLMLRGGRWEDRQILTREYVRQASQTPPGHAALPVRSPERYSDAAAHYGLLWWNNSDAALDGVPRDAFWSWGLYDSLIVVIPSLDIVVARAGKSWTRGENAEHYDVLQPFLQPLVRAATSSETSVEPPYPPSPVVAGLDWAPAATVVRGAKGSDNFPLTWSDDDALYTTFGDGWGFRPFAPEKLSLGFARITGPPDAFHGENLRAPSIEQRGAGRNGRKAWGILAVDGMLYLWLGHADRRGGQSQLAWSHDRGRTWQLADWRFPEFGLIGFVNFGKEYAGARDDFVYAYSHDGPQADTPADRFVLMRVPRQSVRERGAWQCFERRDRRGQPIWSDDIRDRGAVFEHRDACLRSAMTYNAGIRRYLWWQAIPQPPGHADRGDTRFEGGIGIYDAPEPWGPWTTVFFTKRWDMGPGEHGDFPSKWISADGRQLHLAFTGNDHFSVRAARLRLRSPETSPAKRPAE